MSKIVDDSYFNYIFKYIIIGDSAVGKSKLLLRFTDNTYKEEFQCTVGVEFGCRNLEINNKIIRIQIWDTAGMENFRSITRSYYKNSICALVVYDICNRESFNNIEKWILDCKKNAPKSINFVIVGSKLDLEQQRQVPIQDGIELSTKYNSLFYECSAKTGINIDDIFINSAKLIYENIKKGKYNLNDESCGIKKGNQISNNSIIDSINTTKKKKNCC